MYVVTEIRQQSTVTAVLRKRTAKVKLSVDCAQTLSVLCVCALLPF